MLKKESRNQYKMMLRQPVLLVTIILILVMLTLFIIYPMINIVRLGLTGTDGGFTLQKFAEILRNSSYIKTFWNSIKLAIIVAALATLIGYVFAFAITRTEIRGKKLFQTAATLPIISPPFILSLSMIFLFGRQGLITKGLFGITTANVYGMHSLIVVQTISFFPIAFMTLTGILSAIDDSVEDAAYNMGASRGHIFRTVTLPLSMPGIISSMLLVFIQSLEDFANPAVLAGNYSTLSVEAYRLVTGMFDMNGGAVLALFLLLPTLAAYLIQRYWISNKSFVTVTGKPTQKRRKLYEPYIVWPLFAFCSLIFIALVVLYGAVLGGAVFKTWGVDYSLTLDHFKYVFASGWDTLKNSVILAGISAPLAGVMGMVIAYLVVRHRFPGRSYMQFSSILTFAVPGTVLGIGYVFAFNQKPLVLTGTAFILVIAFCFRNMPVGIEAGETTLMQIDKSIEEASTILGAGSGTTFRRITLPLLKQPFFSSLVYSFVRGMTAVSTVIFIISPKWSLATTKIFSLFESSKYSTVAAYIVIMIVIIMIAIGIINLIVEFLFAPKHLRKTKRNKKQAV